MALQDYRRLLLAPAVAGLSFALPLAAQAQETPDRLAALAREARTTRDHADLAKRYRLQAETFDAKAAELEARATRDATTHPGITHKWPAMATQSMTRAKSEAIEARRAARESRLLANRHLRLAVEAEAAD